MSISVKSALGIYTCYAYRPHQKKGHGWTYFLAQAEAALKWILYVSVNK